MRHAVKDTDGRLTWEPSEPLGPLGPQEIRIAVRATAVNRADLMQRAGKYPPPPGASPILGLECAGTVTEVGSQVEKHRPGDEVCALLTGGGYSSEVVVAAGQALPVPVGLSVEEAAALPEVFATAWLNLVREGQLRKGRDRVLLHAAASGVGSAALQLCRLWGNPVAATMGSAEKQAFCEELGAELTVNRHQGPWLPAIQEWGGVDLILDPVGSSYLEDNISALNTQGRLVLIGLLGGASGTLNLGRLLVKRLSVRGSVLRSRSVEEKSSLMASLKEEVWPFFESGQLRPVIHERVSIREVEEAHRTLASDGTIGKLLLTVD